MPINIINVRDLEEEDVKLLESLAERLRSKRLKAKRKKTEEDSFERSAGSWVGLVDGEELIRNVYADRLISSRPEAKL